MIRLAEDRFFEGDDSTAKADIIHEHAILHAIRQESDTAVILIEEALKYYPRRDSIKVGCISQFMCNAQAERGLQ